MNSLIKKSFKKWILLVVLGVVSYIMGFLLAQLQEIYQNKQQHQASLNRFNQEKANN